MSKNFRPEFCLGLRLFVISVSLSLAILFRSIFDGLSLNIYLTCPILCVCVLTSCAKKGTTKFKVMLHMSVWTAKASYK